MSECVHASHIISFANSTVAIEYAGAQAAKIIDFLYHYLPTNKTSTPHINFYLKSDNSGLLSLRRSETLLYQGYEETLVAEQLLGETCYHLADKSSGGLLLHAASIGWQGKGILFPGSSGVGKTTLTAWLLTQGFRYLTDELVFIPQGSFTAQAFTRPLNLKQPSQKILHHLINFDPPSEQILHHHRFDLLSPMFFNQRGAAHTAPLKLIVFPHYRPGESMEWHRLSQAQAGLALMQCLINARNLSNHGFNQIADLSWNIPTYTLQYSRFEQLTAAIEQIKQRVETDCLHPSSEEYDRLGYCAKRPTNLSSFYSVYPRKIQLATALPRALSPLLQLPNHILSAYFVTGAC